jgi:hypothetical protein
LKCCGIREAAAAIGQALAAFGFGLSLFRHGAGVRYFGAHANMACIGEAAMKVILNDLLLFSCLAAFVTGIVIAAATLLI